MGDFAIMLHTKQNENDAGHQGLGVIVLDLTQVVRPLLDGIIDLQNDT